MAGGFGTRLRDEFPDLPKPLVPVDGMPVLYHCIHECLKYDFNEILISTHYHAEMIKQSVIQKFQDANISFIHEDVPLGTCGALLQALPQLDENFLILYADIYSNVNLSHFFNYHLQRNSHFTTVVHPNDHPHDSDLVIFDDNTHQVTEIVPKTRVQDNEWYPNMVNAAMFAMSKKDISLDVVMWDLSSDFIPELIKSGYKVFAYETIEYLKDMGSPERRRQVEADIQSGCVAARTLGKAMSAIFLDRDGCINEHKGYVRTAGELNIISGVPPAIRRFNKAGLLTFCVTNQPVIARGEISEAQLKVIHNKMESELGRLGAYLDDTYYCPHHPDSGYDGERKELKLKCRCRKPGVGMLTKPIEMWGIDTNTSWMIGDTMTDVEAGNRLGLWTVLLSTGDQNKLGSSTFAPPDFIFSDLSNSSTFILEDFGKLYMKANEIVEAVIKSKKTIITIDGLSRSGKSTIAAILKKILIRKRYKTSVITTDIFLNKSSLTHSRVFNYPEAKKMLSGDIYKKLDKKQNSFHIHENNQDIECKPIDLANCHFLILEGEMVNMLSDRADTFKIKLSTREEVRKERFFSKYKARGLNDEVIETLFHERRNNINHYDQSYDMEINCDHK